MITGVASVAVLVNDAKKSLEWYREKLGFEIVAADGHAVFVRPKGSSTLIHLCAKCGDWGGDLPGGRVRVWLRSGEIEMVKDESGLSVPARGETT